MLFVNDHIQIHGIDFVLGLGLASMENYDICKPSSDGINQFLLAILAVILNYEPLEGFSVSIHP
jgi:hypothetical protein